MKIRVVITKEKSRYWAEVLGIPGLVSGRTAEEAARRARKAAALYFEAAAEQLPMPARSGQSVQYLDLRV
ncbi:MAG: hypothetical protein A2W33_07435 [Chloroflexi bacterium RBG_16_52_11]|nr:MAG: hypothetical protein A2W33_07435 [Chloroflexi bacterium RBG_16_52_11]